MPKSSSEIVKPERSRSFIFAIAASMSNRKTLSVSSSEKLWLDALRRGGIKKLPGKSRVDEMIGSNVDRQGEILGCRVLLPSRKCLAGFGNDPSADCRHETGLLRKRDEIGWRDVSPFRVVPPQQRLCAKQRAIRADLRLIEKFKLAIRKRGAQFQGFFV